jgi:hypothetical protein
MVSDYLDDAVALRIEEKIRAAWTFRREGETLNFVTEML